MVTRSGDNREKRPLRFRLPSICAGCLFLFSMPPRGGFRHSRKSAGLGALRSITLPNNPNVLLLAATLLGD